MCDHIENQIHIMSSHEKSGTDISEIINLNIGKKKHIIKFTTLNNTDLYGVYDPEKTSLGNLIDTFFNNYEYKEKCMLRDKIIFFSEEHNQRICDKDSKTMLSEFAFSKITNITMLSESVFSKITNTKMKKVDDCNLVTNSYINIPEKIAELEQWYNLFENKNIQQNIFVKTLTGKTITIKVLNSYLVEDLKALIASREQIPIHQQRIIFAGKAIENNKKICDYNIRDGSTLHMVLRLTGGMYHETSGRAGNYEPLKSCVFYILDDDI